MLSKKTAAGIGIGGFIVAIGVYFLLAGIVFHTHQVNETVVIGKSDVFQFYAEKHFRETLNVTGSSFHVKLKSPDDGLQIDDNFKNHINFTWYSLENGQHTINITDTGNTILQVTGKLNATTNSFELMSHLIVITSGIIIIGISAAFSIRKPRGF
jgi:hypothetical protein